jgi:hypothetical protein
MHRSIDLSTYVAIRVDIDMRQARAYIVAPAARLRTAQICAEDRSEQLDIADQ